MKRKYYAGYGQDDIKVTQKLTVNLGLRYEYFGQLGENYGAQSNFVPSPTAGAGGISTFYLTTKRCNTPLSPDFITALASDSIQLVCSGQYLDWAARKKQILHRASALLTRSHRSWWLAAVTESSTAVSKIRRCSRTPSFRSNST